LKEIEQGSVFSTLVTSADISQDGRLVLIRTYFSAFLFRREDGESVEACLSRAPCRVPLQIEPQGESIAFLADNLSYVTTSEGKHPALHFFTRK
jgi:hypothetical protein